MTFDELFHEQCKREDELPTTKEALAYADGYAAAIADCTNADVAALITERDALSVKLAVEKALVTYYRTLAKLATQSPEKAPDAP